MDVNAADPALFSHVLPLTVAGLLAVGVPLGILAASWLVHRHRPGSPAKDEPYECGLRSVVGGAEERFSVKFYLIAMLFLVFDLEVAFLFPWAVQFAGGSVGSQGWALLGILLIFLVILEVGYLYLWRKGALDWDR